MRKMPAVLLWTLIASAVLVLAGGVTLGLTPQPSASFGWFAYAPMSDHTAFTDTRVLVTMQSIVGFCLAGLGAMGFAMAVGFRLGQRRS